MEKPRSAALPAPRLKNRVRESLLQTVQCTIVKILVFHFSSSFLTQTKACLHRFGHRQTLFDRKIDGMFTSHYPQIGCSTELSLYEPRNRLVHTKSVHDRQDMRLNRPKAMIEDPLSVLEQARPLGRCQHAHASILLHIHLAPAARKTSACERWDQNRSRRP